MADYRYLNCVNSLPNNLAPGDWLVECQFSKCPRGPFGEPILSTVPGVVIVGGNGNNRKFPDSWVLDPDNPPSNAQIKYTITNVETVVEMDGGSETIPEEQITEVWLGRTYADAVAAHPEEF